MKLIKADFERQIAIPGVARPVQRPVDIDKAKTGFVNLRSLRVYQFTAGTTVDGHAEEDEVFVVLMAGAADFTASDDELGHGSQTFELAGPTESETGQFVAYLPPHAAYRLIARADAVVAYARATPPDGNSVAVFGRGRSRSSSAVLIEDKSYARCLRLRVLQIDGRHGTVEVAALEDGDAMGEMLVYVASDPARGGVTCAADGTAGLTLDPWDTVAFTADEKAKFQVGEGSSALLLVVWAV